MNHSNGLRLLAERYLHLADTTSDQAERLKFLDYAQAYADLSKQVAQRDHGDQRSEERTEESTTQEGRPRKNPSAP